MCRINNLFRLDFKMFRILQLLFFRNNGTSPNQLDSCILIHNNNNNRTQANIKRRNVQEMSRETWPQCMLTQGSRKFLLRKMSGIMILITWNGELENWGTNSAGKDFGDRFWGTILGNDFGEQFWETILGNDFVERFWGTILGNNFEEWFWGTILGQWFWGTILCYFQCVV